MVRWMVKVVVATLTASLVASSLVGLAPTEAGASEAPVSCDSVTRPSVSAVGDATSGYWLIDAAGRVYAFCSLFVLVATSCLSGPSVAAIGRRVGGGSLFSLVHTPSIYLFFTL